MRISGTQPLSVISSQACSLKSWKVMPSKMPKQVYVRFIHARNKHNLLNSLLKLFKSFK